MRYHAQVYACCMISSSELHMLQQAHQPGRAHFASVKLMAVCRACAVDACQACHGDIQYFCQHEPQASLPTGLPHATLDDGPDHL